MSDIGNRIPADLPNRGCYSYELQKLKWRERPEWLYLPYDEWPSIEFIADKDKILEGKEKICFIFGYYPNFQRWKLIGVIIIFLGTKRLLVDWMDFEILDKLSYFKRA